MHASGVFETNELDDDGDNDNDSGVEGSNAFYADAGFAVNGVNNYVNDNDGVDNDVGENDFGDDDGDFDGEFWLSSRTHSGYAMRGGDMVAVRAPLRQSLTLFYQK
jgi:hypothetical protein